MQLYFFHTPKTGGTYVHNILKKESIKKSFENQGINIKIIGHEPSHLDRVDYRSSNNLLVTCIRNPVDVIKSLYSHGGDGFSNILTRYNIQCFNQYYELFMSDKIRFYYNSLYVENIFYNNFFNGNEFKFRESFRTDNLENDLKNFFKKYNIEYNESDFNLTDIEKNKFTINDKNSVIQNHHKIERKKNNLITDQMKVEIYNKYKYCFDYFKF